MIRRRATAAGIATWLGNHSFRATGITAYFKNVGTLEKVAQMANHASMRTTQLYDRRREELSLHKVEKGVKEMHQSDGSLKRRDRGEPVREIACSFNVSHSTISRLAA